MDRVGRARRDMPFSFIHEAKAFRELEADWNGCLAQSVTDVPFLRHEFLSTWWNTLGGGEWKDGELWIGVDRGEDGALRGAAPLFRVEDDSGRSKLMFLGTLEISDYLDLLVAKDDVETFVGRFIGRLAAKNSEWDVLDLYNIPEESPTLTALENHAGSHGWSVTRTRLQPCPVVKLEGGWQEYLDGLDGKQRQEIRRKFRRAHRHPLGVSWRVVGAEEDIGPAVDQFIALMAHDQEKRRFLTQKMRTQFETLADEAHRKGWLHLSFLDVGGEPGAGVMSFDYQNRLWIYNSGLDPAHHKLSLGWVILTHLFEWAIENGREAVDFLRGDETYKYRMGGVARYIYRLTITRN
jgi:CelD/BcsL family acetyltransferase involved in cellulose biosynthesis